MTLFLTAGTLPVLGRRILIVAFAIAAPGCSLLGGSPNIMLSGQEEIPAVSTVGFGMGRITVNQQGRVSGSIKVSGVDVTAAHIHIGKLGKIGPPIVTLYNVSGRVWAIPRDTMLSERQYQSYQAGELYINVHSDHYKGGEIRGQLQPGR